YSELKFRYMEKKNYGLIFIDTSTGVNIPGIIRYIKDMNIASGIWTFSEIKSRNHFSQRLKQLKINKLVICGDTPGLWKRFFLKAMLENGNTSTDILTASFKEHGALAETDTNLAIIIVLSAIYGIPFENLIPSQKSDVNADTLVIGGGIAGIQASLEVANANKKVYLVEKSATIGGRMATFDKTFPTLDCAACILTPKMVEVGQHPNIQLMTYCEVTGISGRPGNYNVKILKKARRVNLETCIGCGTCATKCPSKVLSEFDSGTTFRRAIYIPFPQAVPNKYLIDAENCRYVREGKCGVCVKSCPVNLCINLDEKDETVEIKVGNIIVAIGFKPFDAKKIERYGYGKYLNVLTSLEFERLVNASGPTGGKICMKTLDHKGNRVFSTESKEPKSVALIHCIGSRDENHNNYCSKVCCMYSLKLAHLVKEKLPDAHVYQFYIDMRAFGKGYDEFYERIKHEGVQMIRGKTAKIEETDGQLVLRTESVTEKKLMEHKVDMVVLAIGIEQAEDAGNISKMTGVPLSDSGWFKEINYNSEPVGTEKGGIYIAGACQGPKDIPDSVAQGSAAASSVLQSIISGKINGNTNEIAIDKVMLKIKELSTIS
ncbi:MAG: CoB--CoM heterodisulfide reductase iron-sulfur subunit A family protein, partial [Bacteroidetes bacterium]|nr:CoB--CoM heterodisulfide reductase iron-sulfur subunit A family protein [Bacteroidota bacterium]